MFDRIKNQARLLNHAWRCSGLPKSHPEAFLSQPRPAGRVIACLGDSITHGNVSYNWIDDLRYASELEPSHFINAGINGNVVWQLNQRLPTILACQPDAAIVLIGTNDVMGSFHPADGKAYQRGGKLPSVPSQQQFRQEYRKLLRGLQKLENVAVCTLPPLGEEPESAINKMVASFNRDIQSIAKEENAVVLPLGEQLLEIIQNRHAPPREDYRPGPFQRLIPIARALRGYYLLEQSWDQAAATRGLELLPDHIHLGEMGGQILRDLVLDYLQEIENPLNLP